jgi:hypothetical protein
MTIRKNSAYDLTSIESFLSNMKLRKIPQSLLSFEFLLDQWFAADWWKHGALSVKPYDHTY